MEEILAGTAFMRYAKGSPELGGLIGSVFLGAEIVGELVEFLDHL